MIHATGPGSGVSPLSASWSMLGALRSTQAELRAVQKVNGLSTLGDTGGIVARAVTEVRAADITRAPQLRDGDRDATADPLLTGPRPTFAKTPLEKMRTDALSGPAPWPDTPAAPAPEGAAREPAPGEPAPAVTTAPAVPAPAVPGSVVSGAEGAYGTLRGIEAPRLAGSTLDITT